jgi:hypothetical protein
LSSTSIEALVPQVICPAVNPMCVAAISLPFGC